MTNLAQDPGFPHLLTLFRITTPDFRLSQSQVPNQCQTNYLTLSPSTNRPKACQSGKSLFQIIIHKQN